MGKIMLKIHGGLGMSEIIKVPPSPKKKKNFEIFI